MQFCLIITCNTCVTFLLMLVQYILIKILNEARRTRGNFSQRFSAIFPKLHILVAKKVAKKLHSNYYMCDLKQLLS